MKKAVYNRAIMVKRLIVLISVLVAFAAAPSISKAESQTCVQVYGGGVVCGASTPNVTPAPTGLGENLAVIGGTFILASGILLYFAKRTKKSLAR